jgi:hypothetical protein
MPQTLNHNSENWNLKSLVGLTPQEGYLLLKDEIDWNVNASSSFSSSAVDDEGANPNGLKMKISLTFMAPYFLPFNVNVKGRKLFKSRALTEQRFRNICHFRSVKLLLFHCETFF